MDIWTQLQTGSPGYHWIGNSTPNPSQNQSDMGTSDNRSICIQTNTPITGILQLETRPSSLSDGCLSSGLVREDLLCESSMGPNVESPVGSQPPTSRCDNSSPGLEKANHGFQSYCPCCSTFPISSFHQHVPYYLNSQCHLPSILRKYNWPYGPPQGILSNRKAFRTSFRTSHCIMATQVHQILQLTLLQVGVLVCSME